MYVMSKARCLATKRDDPSMRQATLALSSQPHAFCPWKVLPDENSPHFVESAFAVGMVYLCCRAHVEGLDF